jgi:hypothetical protein
VIYAEDGYEKKAILLAESMRRNGAVVEFALEDTAEAALQYAKTRNVPKLYRVEEEVTEVTVL